MNGDTASTSILVEQSALETFRIFTEEVDSWWKAGPAYRFGGERKGRLRFEPGVGGRLVESYTADSSNSSSAFSSSALPKGEDQEWEVGKIHVWDPGLRLVFEFRQSNFLPEQTTEVEVLFETVRGGTRVTVIHRGWDSIPRGHAARHGLDRETFERVSSNWWLTQLRVLRST